MIAVIVQTHQRYGGPEEGGWWYHVSEFTRMRKCDTKRQARRQKRKWQRELGLPVSDRYGQETYAAIVDDEHIARVHRQQRTRPYYC